MEGIQGHNLVLPPHYNMPKVLPFANVMAKGIYRDNDIFFTIASAVL